MTYDSDLVNDVIPTATASAAVPFNQALISVVGITPRGLK